MCFSKKLNLEKVFKKYFPEKFSNVGCSPNIDVTMYVLAGSTLLHRLPLLTLHFGPY